MLRRVGVEFMAASAIWVSESRVETGLQPLFLALFFLLSGSRKDS